MEHQYLIMVHTNMLSEKLYRNTHGHPEIVFVRSQPIVKQLSQRNYKATMLAYVMQKSLLLEHKYQCYQIH